MDEFVEYLAVRKYGLYRLLHKTQPQAYTEEECFKRIQNKAKYIEVIDTVGRLPLEHQIKVNKLYDQMINENY